MIHSAKAKKTLLVMSVAILAFNLVDRQVLALVLQDIKVDLSLSDTQLGLLSGIAFTAFYATMGIPIARVADRGNRVAVIAMCAAIWSVFVVICGAATTFVQLFLIRIGVATGEAGCIPPAQSLLSEFFSRPERPRAFAIYSLGSPLSVILGGFVAGWINEYLGWRATFMILGCPGVVLAILAWRLLEEPRLKGTAESGTESRSRAQLSATHSLAEVRKALAQNRTFRQLLLANTILYFFIYGIVLQWQPSFFIRTYGLSTGELGTWEVLIWSVMGSLGVYGGGVLCHRFMARNESRQLRLMGVSITIFGALNALIYLARYRYEALGLAALAAPFYSGLFGPMFAVNQSVVPDRMRATAMALTLLFSNLIGMGLGGLVTGFLSDALRPAYGQESLRYALLAMTPGFAWCAMHFWLAARTVHADIDRAHVEPHSLEPADALRA